MPRTVVQLKQVAYQVVTYVAHSLSKFSTFKLVRNDSFSLSLPRQSMSQVMSKSVQLFVVTDSRRGSCRSKEPQCRQCKRVRNLENTRQQTIYSRKTMSIDMLLMAACSSSSSSTERSGVGEKSEATNPREADNFK